MLHTWKPTEKMDRLQALEFKRMRKMVRRFFRTGVSQILFAMIIVILGIIGLSNPHVYGTPGYMVMSLHMNIWFGILFCITGGMGIATRDNPSESLSKAYFRFGILCLLLCIALILVNVFGVVSAVASRTPSSHLLRVIHWLFFPLEVVELVLFIVSSSYKCCQATEDRLNDMNPGQPV